MALPTITNNSPSAGYISWTAFGIQYDGVSYSVAAGNANTSFVIWQFNRGGTPILLKTDVFPATLTADDQILFLNKGGVGALVPMTDVLDGSLVVPGSIIANTIAANAIQTYHLNANVVTAIQIAANTITSNEIASNAITGDEIAANTITTDKLGVGSVGNNMVTNGSFEEAYNGIPIGWKGNPSNTNGTTLAVTGVATTGTNAVMFDIPAITDKAYLQQLPEKYIPVAAIAGRKWYFSVKVGAGTPIASGFYFRVIWYDAAKNYLTYSSVRGEDGTYYSDQPVGGAFGIFEGVLTPNVNARYMSVEVSVQTPDVPTKVYVDEIVAREVVTSAVIGDGAISTPKILANAVIAEHIQSNTINATHIQTSSITTDKLLITDMTNLVENPDFEDDVIGAEPKGYYTSGDIVKVMAGGANASGKAVAIYANVGNNSDLDAYSYIPVRPGDKLYVNYDYKFLNTAGTAGFTVGFRTYGPAKASVATGYPGGQITTRPLVWTNSGALTYTVPAGIYYLRPWITFRANGEATNQVHLDNVTVRRMNKGELIVDGAINTNHITTNTINADRLILNSITSGLIGANAITALHLNATAIDGKVITGGTVQTSSVTNTVNARMGPISAYDPFGAKTTPGIGFVKNGAAGAGPSMYSSDGYQLVITQGGTIAAAGLDSYINLGNNAAIMSAKQAINITAGAGATISAGAGDLNLNGTNVKINGAKQGLRHITSNLITSSPPANTAWGPGLFTVNVAKSSSDITFLSFPASDQIKFLEAGVYSISVTVSNKITTPSGARILLQDSTKATTYMGAVKPDGGAWEWSLVMPNYYATANEILALVFVHNGTGTQSWDSVLRVTQIH